MWLPYMDKQNQNSALLTTAKLCNNCYTFDIIISSSDRLCSLRGFYIISVRTFLSEIWFHDTCIGVMQHDVSCWNAEIEFCPAICRMQSYRIAHDLNLCYHMLPAFCMLSVCCRCFVLAQCSDQLDDPGFEYHKGQEVFVFSKPFTPALAPIQHTIEHVSEVHGSRIAMS